MHLPCVRLPSTPRSVADGGDAGSAPERIRPSHREVTMSLTAAEPSPTRSAASAIPELVEPWTRACLARDWDAVLGMCTDDVVFSPPNEPLVEGQAVRPWLEIQESQPASRPGWARGEATTARGPGGPASGGRATGRRWCAAAPRRRRRRRPAVATPGRLGS